MSDDKIDKIRARHEEGERANAVADREWLLGKIERLTRERDEALAKVEGLTTSFVNGSFSYGD